MDKITILDKDIYYHDSDDPVISYLKANKLYGGVQYSLLSQYALGTGGYIIDCGAGIGTFSFLPATKNLSVLTLEEDPDNFNCLQKTYSGFGNVIVKNTYNIDKACVDHSIDHVDIIKFSTESKQTIAIENAKKILNRCKPVLLLCINSLKINPRLILSKIEELGYFCFLYNAANFLIYVDKTQVFPFCLMDLICIHKENLYEYIGKITIGSSLPDNAIQNIVKENLSSTDHSECKKYLELIRYEQT